MPRKVYICPEVTCINHQPSHALGDFGGLKKHYLRKHSNDKKHKCDNCSKTYAVESDLRAHLKNCSTKRYICQCGARFSSSHRFGHHQDYCDAQVLEDASIYGNNNTTNSISSTTSYLPSSYMGDNSIGSTTNINNNSLIGSTTSYLPISAMGSNNNINNLIDSTMSHLQTFNSHIGFTTPHLGPQISSSQNQTSQSRLSPIITEHGSLTNDPSWGLNMARIPYNISSLSSTPQNQHEFQEKTGMGYYTNLMNIDYSNVNHENTSFMGDVSHYGSVEGSNLYSGPGSSSSEFQGFNMLPFGTPNLVANMDLYGSASGNSNASNMVQPYAMSSSSYGGYIIPQEHNSLFDNQHFGIAENSGFHDIMNTLHNPVTGRGVEFSTINENVGSSYNQGNYSGYVDGSGYINYGAEREVWNSGTLGAVAPADENQYWNQHGFGF
ncbi:protein indeterminate-domain 6, chloroplastic [Lactuca sativa]|uniref:protein indeterminate-domain 6, chloroplastic n=1 Tax=Lactuca sativa TaxID=4236 RepID=UPI000CD8831B|nr:protein indeterminate-domain 6, chloroplastic [Lactuca sativa]